MSRLYRACSRIASPCTSKTGPLSHPNEFRTPAYHVNYSPSLPFATNEPLYDTTPDKCPLDLHHHYRHHLPMVRLSLHVRPSVRPYDFRLPSLSLDHDFFKHPLRLKTDPRSLLLHLRLQNTSFVHWFLVTVICARVLVFIHLICPTPRPPLSLTILSADDEP